MPSQRASEHGTLQARSHRALLSYCAILCMTPLTLSHLAGAGGPDHLSLFPKLQASQTVTYRISYRVEKHAKTQSSVVMAQTPGSADVDVQGLLRLDILGVEAQGQRATIHARTTFQAFDAETNSPSESSSQSPSTQPPASEGHGIAVEFTISPNGRFDQIKNLDALSPDQQQAWQQWASTFAAFAAFPPKGVKVDEKWKSEEPEKASSPIAGLIWNRESTYLRNEPCRITRPSAQPDVAGSNRSPETCAVIQTMAILRQKSSPQNSTPEDFKLNHLRTMGTASGSNKTLLYISLSTGLVIRASDQADQTMNVTIAKSNNSNRVHYDLHAKSNAEIFQIADVSQPNP